MADPLEDLAAITALTTDPRVVNRWRYYIGDHPKVYATPKLHELFRTLADSLTENYCGLAVQSRIDRLEVEGWQGDAAEQADMVWEASKGNKRQDRLYRWALAQGSAWIIVDGSERTMTFNPASLCAAIPDPDDPDLWRVGGKVWRTGDGGRRAVLYYPDQTIRFASDGDRGEFRMIEEPTPQPLGIVPLVKVDPFGNGPVMLDTIAPVQDRINKIVANTMVAAEFGAFRQRIFFTRQAVDAYDVRQAPDHAIVLDPGDPGDGQARMQESTATDLSIYDNAKNSAVDALFTVGMIPRHLRVNPGAVPSGEAIKADEGPMVQAIREHQREMGEALGEAMAMLDVPDVEPVWRDPEVHDDKVNAETVAILVGAGVPWQIAVQTAAGWTQADVTEAELVLAQPTGVGSAIGTELLNAFNTNPIP